MSDYDNNFARCENCDFYAHANKKGKCTRYNFLMPQIGWYTLCRDWRTNGESIDLSSLEARKLYYYSNRDSGLIYAPLASFQQLHKQLISVSIRRDLELGWIIYPRKQYEYFPEPGKWVTIRVGERKSKFEVANEERKLAIELIPNEANEEDNKWEKQHHMQQVFMLHSVESPDLLYEWYNDLIDIEAFAKSNAVSASLHAFLQIEEAGSEYRLMADLLNYQNYVR